MITAPQHPRESMVCSSIESICWKLTWRGCFVECNGEVNCSQQIRAVNRSIQKNLYRKTKLVVQRGTVLCGSVRRRAVRCGAVRKRKYNRCGDTACGRIRSTDLNVKATISSRGPKVPGWRAPVRRRFAGKAFGSGFCNNELAILSKPEIAENVFSRNYESCNNSSGWFAHS